MRIWTGLLVGAGLVAIAPLYGYWWVLLLWPAMVAAWVICAKQVKHSRRPEYWVIGPTVTGLLVIGTGVVLSGGPHSPAMIWLTIPPMALPVRFPMRVVITGTGLAVAVMLASSIGTDPAGFVADPFLTIAASTTLIVAVAYATAMMKMEMQQRTAALVDPLTGLLNRSSVTNRFRELTAQAAHNSEPLTLVVFDIDHFKAVNDAHGHAAGDQVLREIADAVRDTMRSFDLLYRIGGEEFLLLLPGVDTTEGLAVAERIRSTIEHRRSAGLTVTISAGVCTARGAGLDYDSVFAKADAALYQAKLEGRNRVVASGAAAKTLSPIRSAA